MCSLIIDWKPGAFLVGANRDESPTRPSEGFAWRGNIFCPLDIRGGSWIGINRAGLFAGLTNLNIRDETDPEVKRITRGKIITEALQCDRVWDASNIVYKLVNEDLYYPFNLFIADKDHLFAIVHDPINKRIFKFIDAVGLHIATGWGIDRWDIPRCCYAKWKWNEPRFRSDTPDPDIKKILSYHGDGGGDTAVCVHSGSHQTRSSCIIHYDEKFKRDDPDSNISFIVEHSDKPACVGEWKEEVW